MPETPATTPAPNHAQSRLYSFEELLSTGLLWLINTSVLHPRGYAMSIEFDDQGKAIGWHLMGDGGERWEFADDAETRGMTDERFRMIRRLLP